MYVCPSCSEQIPDRVRKANDECPFCHSPFPPDETDGVEPEPEPVDEPAKPDGWGKEFKSGGASGAAGTPAAAAAEPPKSKVGLIVGILVVLLGGGAGLYFGVLRKSGKQGNGPSAQGQAVAGEDLSAAARYYKNARKTLYAYVAGTCQSYHDHGFHYFSRLSPVTTMIKRRRKEVKLVTFKLLIQPDPKGKASGPLDAFACPYRIATLHRDHPFIIEAKIWEKRAVFGAVRKIAEMEIKGKLTGYLKQKKYRSLAAQTLKGFSFPKLKSASDPGLKALATPMPFHMAINAKTFTLANLRWKKIAPGKYIQGTWRLEVRSNELKDQFEAWAQACEGMQRRKFAHLDRPAVGHKLHHQIFEAARAVVRDYCHAVEKMSKALSPWKQADVDAARATLEAAKKRWEAQVRKPILAMAKKLHEAVLLKPL